MRLLIIEDEKEISDFLKRGLEHEGFAVDCAADGEKGLFLAKTNDYDLVIVDNRLPKMSGLVVCSEIRRSGRLVPILALSVVTDPREKVGFLNAGADDYLTKPFSFAELVARMRALLRRTSSVNQEVMQVDDLVLDTMRHTVTRGGRNIHLTRKEFALLEYLLKNLGLTVSRTMILEHVWDIDADPFSNTIEAHILSLRHKIDADFPKKLLHTMHGLGYKLDVEK